MKTWKAKKNTQKRIQIDLCSSHHRSLTYIKKNTRSNRSYSTAFVYRVYVSVCVCVCVIFFHWHSNRSYVLFPFFGRFFDSFAFYFVVKLLFSVYRSLSGWLIRSSGWSRSWFGHLNCFWFVALSFAVAFFFFSLLFRVFIVQLFDLIVKTKSSMLGRLKFQVEHTECTSEKTNRPGKKTETKSIRRERGKTSAFSLFISSI